MHLQDRMDCEVVVDDVSLAAWSGVAENLVNEFLSVATSTARAKKSITSSSLRSTHLHGGGCDPAGSGDTNLHGLSFP